MNRMHTPNARIRNYLPFMVCVVLTVVWLTGCDNSTSSTAPRAPTDSEQAAVQQDLQGSWLREYQEGGIRASRLLVLETDGSLTEMASVTDTARAVTDHRHEGTWLYDGTNLKRKYTRMDGKPPSRLNLPFAAFEVKFVSINEFVGLDNVHHNEVRYHRVQPETLL
jgi:hypothetical protein